MVLSRLQRYILTQALAMPKKTLSRGSIAKFYSGVERRPKGKDLANIISRSVDRLIARELLVGYGKKTATKWFVETVRLTPKGRGEAKRLLGEQQTLPLKIKNVKIKMKNYGVRSLPEMSGRNNYLKFYTLHFKFLI